VKQCPQNMTGGLGFFLVLTLAALAGAPGAAADNFTVAVGQDKVFTIFNLQNAWFVQDPFNPQPLPAQKVAWAQGNEAQTAITSAPGCGGLAFGEVGVRFSWDLGSLTWNQVKDWPVRVKVDLTHYIEAGWAGNASANASVLLMPFLYSDTAPFVPQIGVNCYDFIGVGVGYGGARGDTRTTTFTKTHDGQPLTVGNLAPEIKVLVESQAASVSDSQFTSTAAARIMVNRIRIEFPRMALLLHGIWSSSDMWITSGVAGLLLGNGYKVSLLDFCPNNDYVIHQGLEVADRMKLLQQENPGVRVDIVAHSMGGLAARWYLANPQLWPTDDQGQPRHMVRKLITLGTPHLGTDIHLLHPIGANFLELKDQSLNGCANNYYEEPPYNFRVWSPALQDMTAVWKQPGKWKQKGVKGLVEPMTQAERAIPGAFMQLNPPPPEWVELLALFPPGLDQNSQMTCLNNHIDYYYLMKDQIIGPGKLSSLLDYLKKVPYPKDIDYYVGYGTEPSFFGLVEGDYGDGVVPPDSAAALGVKFKKKVLWGISANHVDLAAKAKDQVLQFLQAPPLK